MKILRLHVLFVLFLPMISLIAETVEQVGSKITLDTRNKSEISKINEFIGGAIRLDTRDAEPKNPSFDFQLSSNSIKENEATSSIIGRFQLLGKKIPSDGLVSWFEFDGDFQNSAISEFSGESKGVKLGKDRKRRDNQALIFDGVDDTFTFEIRERLLSNFTVSFWANHSKTTTVVGESTSGGPMANRHHSTLLYYPMGDKSVHQVGFGIVLGTNALNVAHLAGGRAPSTMAYKSDLTGWNHYVVSCVENKVSLYLNGVFAKEGIAFNRTNILGPTIILGKNYKNGFYKGSLDDFRIYDRSFNSEDAASLYEWEQDRDSVSYAFVDGQGSSGNPNFTLSKEGVLKTGKRLSYQDGSEYSIRVQATNNEVKVSKIFKITILPNSIVVPPPSTPSNPWQKRYEELLIVINDTKEKIKVRNADLEEKEEKAISLEKEKAEIKEKIAELGLDVSSKQERIASLNKEVEQARAKLELEELAQANLLAEISEQEGVFEKRKTESDQLSEQVEGIESTLASLNLKLKVPHVRGWHYATEKGWMWTDLDIYPLVFFIDKNKWFEYEQGSAHPWIYKDIETNTSWQWSE